jgi:ribosomal protein L11 methyltransferase
MVTASVPAAAPAAWRVAATVPAAAAGAAEAALAEDCQATSWFETDDPGRVCVEGYAAGRPDAGLLAARLALAVAAAGVPGGADGLAVTMERVPPTDWLTAVAQAFPPFRVGRFDIRGSHVGEPPPAGALPLRIDAATAFGTGEHASTEGCLLALAGLARRLRVRRALDMGCGTGILAFAMVRLWRRPVLAVDSEPESVRVARVNARVNGLAPLVRVVRGDGYRTPAVRAAAPFDLIAANILARPLAQMAPALARCLAPGGTALLSGLLARQAPGVLAAHRAQGLHLAGRVSVRGWTTLIVTRPGGRD